MIAIAPFVLSIEFYEETKTQHPHSAVRAPTGACVAFSVPATGNTLVEIWGDEQFVFNTHCAAYEWMAVENLI